MYVAPDFVKIELEQGNVFSSSCQPGHEKNNIDYSGDDLSGCEEDITINGITVYDCYFDKNA